MIDSWGFDDFKKLKKCTKGKILKSFKESGGLYALVIDTISGKKLWRYRNVDCKPTEFPYECFKSMETFKKYVRLARVKEIWG